MFPRQPAAGDADIYQDATTTLRSAFPNSRLDSLAAHPTPANEADPNNMDSQLAAPDPTELGGANAGYNPLDDDWWSNAIEVDTFDSPLAFDASENGLWNGHFVPPPPRPPFLDESVAADGLTTCDLCTWAWQRNAYSLDGSIGGRPQPWWCRNNRNGGGQNRSPISIKHSADSIRRPTSNSGVWTWLGGSRRSSAGPDQIGPPSTSPAENHYTHMDDAYSPVGVSEALYAELDRESVRSANPSYQNTAYSQCGEKYNFQAHEQDIPMVVSSAPSSAYYSDLSVTAMPGGASGSNQGAYEIVGLNVMSQPLPNWEHHVGGAGGGGGGNGVGGVATTGLAPGDAAAAVAMTQRRMPRLAAINETSTSTVPSDYV
ncbi:GH15159 [Drosophila grimshawi]|uniref:GH15159 n=1 Tax=Drosophila grimshawi TaxID=7222 RepID=B4IXX7_DROGR|nr:GH15159 [Drosophila grimshawi]